MHRMALSSWSIDQDRCLGDPVGFGFAPGELYFPNDLALDPKGQIYISQPFEGRVQVFQGLAPAAPLPDSP